MKKTVVILMALIMAGSLAACGGREEPGRNHSSAESASSVENDMEETEDPLGDGNADADNNTSAEDTESDVNDSRGKENDTDTGSYLVAYFSATGMTEGAAESLAEGTGADIYKIVPEEPYTDDDLDYHDDNSRSTIEMNDPAARPAISGSVENMEQYEVVFLGYPIWWGEAPRIMSTFMESYDFSGKTIVPFCTSGSSGIGSSADNLAELTSGAEWLTGQRFDGGESSSEMAEWAESLGLDALADNE